MQLDDAISAINNADDPIDAFNRISEVYEGDDADLILPWLAEMAAALQLGDD